jgi:hypothetical protein
VEKVPGALAVTGVGELEEVLALRLFVEHPVAEAPDFLAKLSLTSSSWLIRNAIYPLDVSV